MKSKLFASLAVFLLISAVTFAVIAENENTQEENKELFKSVQLFADAVTLISADYVEPVKAKDLIYGAIKGMMGTLDDYSQFLDQDSFKEITEDTKGEFGGIGIEVGIRSKVLTVLAPIEDTPAERAGLKKGDKIIKIDGKLTRGLNLSELVKKLKGDPGTRVKLTIYRKGEDKLIDFTIRRAIIKLKSIEEAIMLDDEVSYVSIVEFQERTARDLRDSINMLIKKGATGVILDVRNNPGGLLNSSVDVADLFLEQGRLIVYTEGRDPQKRLEFRSKKKSDFDDVNLVVLVNRASASASEILAGAIKDNGRGIIVGETTFGKGSVQTIIPLKDRSALRLTTASYFTPAGTNLRDKGIEPDIKVSKCRPQKRKEKTYTPDLFDILAEEGKIDLTPEDDEETEDDKKKEPAEEIKEIDPEVKKLLDDHQLSAAYNVLKGIDIFLGSKDIKPYLEEDTASLNADKVQQ